MAVWPANGYKRVVTTEWLQPSGYKRLITNDWLQTIDYKRLFTNDCLQTIDYKPLITNDWLQTIDYKRLATNDSLQTTVYKRVATRWWPTQSWYRSERSEKIRYESISFGGSWSRVIRTGIAYSNNFTATTPLEFVAWDCSRERVTQKSPGIKWHRRINESTFVTFEQ